MNATPYLFFEGRCEEAATFYEKAIGAEIVSKMRYSDNPEPQPGSVPPGGENKIMHMSLKIGGSDVMASDGHCSGKTAFGGFSLTLNARDEAHAEQLFNALADGGQVQMPLTTTFFSPKFGMLADRFGLGWMVMVDTTG